MADKEEYNYFLPREVLTYIFGFVERKTLVFGCRLACRFWREAAESSAVWKEQIRRDEHLLASELRDLLPTAHLKYPWYVCYVLCKHIFCRNLMPDCCCEDNMAYWRDLLSRSNGLVCSAPLGTNPQGYSVAPPDLDAGVKTCLLTSFGDCRLNQAIDFYGCGFTRKIFEFRPAIHLSEWFCVGYNFSGVCHIEVTLFNSHWESDQEHGHFRYTRRLRNRQWQKVSHTFTNYRPDVRYITINHGVNTYLPHSHGRCREIVNFGKAAAKIVGGKISISLPEITDSPASSPSSDSDHSDQS